MQSLDEAHQFIQLCHDLGKRFFGKDLLCMCTDDVLAQHPDFIECLIGLEVDQPYVVAALPDAQNRLEYPEAPLAQGPGETAIEA